MNFWHKIKRFFSSVTKCQHKHYTEHRWLDNDDTPMVDFLCEDCGFHDFGHVHADPKTWVKGIEQ